MQEQRIWPCNVEEELILSAQDLFEFFSSVGFKTSQEIVKFFFSGKEGDSLTIHKNTLILRREIKTYELDYMTSASVIVEVNGKFYSIRDDYDSWREGYFGDNWFDCPSEHRVIECKPVTREVIDYVPINGQVDYL